MGTISRSTAEQPTIARSALTTGIIIGIGWMGAVDEIVFHQLLQWHYFYVHTTEYWRIFSDGLFHAFTTAMLVFGLVRLWMQRHQITTLANSRPLVAGVLLGAGGFQLFDGIVNHKLLNLHPVREGVSNLLPYDLAWNALAVVLLMSGWLAWRGVPKTR